MDFHVHYFFKCMFINHITPPIINLKIAFKGQMSQQAWVNNLSKKKSMLVSQYIEHILCENFRSQ